MVRLSPADRREAIIVAALTVGRRKGLAATTVRDVAAEMGTSGGLIHHYFESMDDVLAAAFARVAEADLERTAGEMAVAAGPAEALAAFFRTYAPADADWAFQLWLDAWAEAARRPPIQATSRRLNLAWQALLEETIRAGVARGVFVSAEPGAAAWRILSVVDGLALQVVAHATTIGRGDVERWASRTAELELGMPPGALDPGRIGSARPASGRRLCVRASSVRAGRAGR
jgi:AcrR family transcriptional regulator